MRFYLLQNRQFLFGTKENVKEKYVTVRLTNPSMLLSSSQECLISLTNHHNFTKLKKELLSPFGVREVVPDDDAEEDSSLTGMHKVTSWDLLMVLSLEEGKLKVRLEDHPFYSYEVGLFERFCELIDVDDISLKLHIQDGARKESDGHGFDFLGFKTEGIADYNKMKIIRRVPDQINAKKPLFAEGYVPAEVHCFSPGDWMGKGFLGKFNLYLDISDDSSFFVQRDFGVVEMNRMILENKLNTDLAIILANGESLKCHKCVLSAQSAVFERMFKTDMEESRTNQVEIKDLTLHGGKALLAYVYYMDKSEAVKSCEVAFELFQVSHMYGISKLEASMIDLIMKKSDGWLTVDIAVKLYLFILNLHDGIGEKLKWKAVQALKLRTQELDSSSMYDILFKEHPEAAKKLCGLLLRASSPVSKM